MPVDWFAVIAPVIVLVLLVLWAVLKKRRLATTAAWLGVVYLAIYLGPGLFHSIRAHSGDVEAQYQLGIWYLDRFAYSWPNQEASKYWLRRAAESNHRYAMVKLAWLIGIKNSKLSDDERQEALYWAGKADKRATPGASELRQYIETHE